MKELNDNEVKNFLEDIKFDELLINKKMDNINSRLKKYIEKNVLPEYNLNDKGHDLKYIEYVLKRAFELSNGYDINDDMLYTCVCFHDVACHVNREKHEILSANKAKNDKFLNEYFNNEKMNIITEAIEEHRASLEYVPRNIYGKILSTADRKIEVKEYLKASISFEINNNPNILKSECIENSYEFAIKKFGKTGYAISKTYIEDIRYKDFLENMWYLIENKNLYTKLASIIYEQVVALVNNT